MSDSHGLVAWLNEHTARVEMLLRVAPSDPGAVLAVIGPDVAAKHRPSLLAHGEPGEPILLWLTAREAADLARGATTGRTVETAILNGARGPARRLLVWRGDTIAIVHAAVTMTAPLPS